VTPGTLLGQLLQTTAAVAGHTDMALRMLDDPATERAMQQLVQSNGMLYNDITAMRMAEAGGGLATLRRT